MGRVGDDELGIAHGARDGAGGDIALALAARGLHFGRAFAFLVFVAHFLMRHLEAALLAHPLNRQIDKRDDDQPARQREDQRNDRVPGGR